LQDGRNKILEHSDEKNRAELIDRLTQLEYAIRQSMIVREDQDEPADPQHISEAARYGIAVANTATKEELLNAVQTLCRAMQKKRPSGSGDAP
jgi:hypothetical protein